MVPEMLITAAPKIPGVAAHDFLRRERNSAIHWLKDIGCDLRKIGRSQPGEFRFVFRCFAATGGNERERKQGTAEERRETRSRRQTALLQPLRFHATVLFPAGEGEQEKIWRFSHQRTRTSQTASGLASDRSFLPGQKTAAGRPFLLRPADYVAHVQPERRSSKRRELDPGNHRLDLDEGAILP